MISHSASDVLGRVVLPVDEVLRRAELRDSAGVELLLTDVKGKKSGKSTLTLAFKKVGSEEATTNTGGMGGVGGAAAANAFYVPEGVDEDSGDASFTGWFEPFCDQVLERRAHAQQMADAAADTALDILFGGYVDATWQKMLREEQERLERIAARKREERAVTVAVWSDHNVSRLAQYPYDPRKANPLDREALAWDRKALLRDKQRKRTKLRAMNMRTLMESHGSPMGVHGGGGGRHGSGSRGGGGGGSGGSARIGRGGGRNTSSSKLGGGGRQRPRTAAGSAHDFARQSRMIQKEIQRGGGRRPKSALRLSPLDSWGGHASGGGGRSGGGGGGGGGSGGGAGGPEVTSVILDAQYGNPGEGGLVSRRDTDFNGIFGSIDGFHGRGADADAWSEAWAFTPPEVYDHTAQARDNGRGRDEGGAGRRGAISPTMRF